VIVALALAGCGQQPAADRAESPRGRAAAKGTALAALDTLAVKGRAPKTGYDREQFGGDWVSVDGCDVRQRVLRRDLRREALAPGSTCEVQAGVLADPYTATAIEYVSGEPVVDIDHVVALGDAWQKGAQQLPYARRVELANDPLNLLAVDASANRQKGDADAATWLPANTAFRCAYVARQIAVKRRYRAWVTPAERDAIRRVLARCPRTPLPTARRVRVTGELTGCDALRAAGRAPVARGERGYDERLDGDGDGVACE